MSAKRLLGDLIPARMRHRQYLLRALQYRMVLCPQLLEYADAFFRKWPSIDAVNVKYGGVHSEARPDCRTCACLGPFDDPHEIGPVGFVRQLRRLWLRAGHDQAIQCSVAEIIDAEITPADMFPAPFRPDHGREGIKLQLNRIAIS